MKSSFFHCGMVVVLMVSIALSQPKQEVVRQVYTDSSLALTVQNIEKFVQWASRADSATHLKVREAILRARGDSTVLPLLFEQFEGTRTRDVGKSLIILGIIGELRNPLAMKRLDSIINKPLLNEGETNPRLLRHRDTIEILQSKAVEALAYLQTPESDTLVLRVIRTHPSMAVQSMAIDAYLYNHGDTEAAKTELRMELASKEGTKNLAPLVDRVRRTEAIDPATFKKGIENFYARYPNQLAQKSMPVGIATSGLFENKLLWLSLILFVILILSIFLIYFVLKRFKKV